MPTPANDASEPAAPAEPVAPVVSAASIVGASEEADPFPPALIVALRAPDRPVARIIGAMTPAQARLGAAVTFAISPQGRLLERAAVGEATRKPARPNVLSLPLPRLSALPTRVATTTVLDEGTDEATDEA